MGPKQATTLEGNGSQTQVQLTSVTDDQVAALLKEGSITPEIEQALRKILDQKAQVAELNSEAEARDTETSSIYDYQQRLRENLKSLKGTAEEKALTQRYTKQLSDQETRLDKLREEKADLEGRARPRRNSSTR
jgi:septal ring factor EnvC (AmiA/AmiB activator)